MNLLNSIRSKNAAAVEQALAAGHSPRECDEDGWTPLHYAVHTAYRLPTESVRRMIQLGADVNAKIKSEVSGGWGGCTPLLVAMICDSWEAASALVEAGSDVDAEAANGHRPLSLAGTRQKYEFAALLIKRGANVNKKGRNGKTVADQLYSVNQFAAGDFFVKKFGAKTT